MSDYRNVKTGGLKIKNKPLFKADKKANKKSKTTTVVDQDKVDHGGWRRIVDELDVRGGSDVCIETGDASRRYVAAMDNGKFTLGAPHPKAGDKPNPEEIFAMIKTPDDSKFSMKTGYGKYIGVDANGYLVATADAIGPRERFEAVFQDGLCAVQSVSSGLFLSLKTNDEDLIMVVSKTAKEHEIVNLRTLEDRQEAPDYIPADDRKAAGACEWTYQQMYQHSKVVTKNRMINYDRNDKTSVKQAQQEGNLHEVLLNRRAKQKSDKYC
uniref:Actin-bundling protein n=1 Tax=Panagrolaimus superbus TaxID=310955 RepID=A0A914XWN0_9BILA